MSSMPEPPRWTVGHLPISTRMQTLLVPWLQAHLQRPHRYPAASEPAVVAALGHVADLHFTVSHRYPKLIAIDKQPNDNVMHLDRSGKADCLAGEPLDPGPQRQMFALNLLRVPLARLVLVGIEMPCVRAPIIGVIAPDTKRLEQPFELQKHVVLTPAKNIRQHLARVVINRVPEPARLAFLVVISM